MRKEYHPVIDAENRVMSYKMKFDAVPDPFKLRQEGTTAAVIGGPLSAVEAVGRMGVASGSGGVAGAIIICIVAGVGFFAGSVSGVYKATVLAHTEKLGQNAYIDVHGETQYNSDLAEQREKNGLLKEVVATTTKAFEARPDIQGTIKDKNVPYSQRSNLQKNPEILVRNAIVRGNVDLIALKQQGRLEVLSETLVRALSQNTTAIKEDVLEKKLPGNHSLVGRITQALRDANYPMSVASPSPIVGGVEHTPPSREAARKRL